jgi:hypothetical protein
LCWGWRSSSCCFTAPAQPLLWQLLLRLRLLPMVCSCVYETRILQWGFIIYYEIAVTHAGVFLG